MGAAEWTRVCRASPGRSATARRPPAAPSCTSATPTQTVTSARGPSGEHRPRPPSQSTSVLTLALLWLVEQIRQQEALWCPQQCLLFTGVCVNLVSRATGSAAWSPTPALLRAAAAAASTYVCETPEKPVSVWARVWSGSRYRGVCVCVHPLQAKCIKTGLSSHVCQCLSGWTEDGDECQPINNCQGPDRGGCHPNASCIYVGPGQVPHPQSPELSETVKGYSTLQRLHGNEHLLTERLQLQGWIQGRRTGV